MPTLVEIQDAAYGHFVDEFPALQPTVTVTYEGLEFNETAQQDAWVRLSLMLGDEFAASIPARRRRQQGEFMVQVFTPAGLGTTPGLGISQSALNVMKGLRVSGVRFLGVRRPEKIGADGRWFQYNVSMPFESDNIT